MDTSSSYTASQQFELYGLYIATPLIAKPMVPAPAPCAIPSASESKTGAFGRRYETCLGSKKASLPDQSCEFRPFTKKTSGLRVPLKFKDFRLNP